MLLDVGESVLTELNASKSFNAKIIEIIEENPDFCKIMKCLNEDDGDTIIVRLEGIWSDTQCHVGSSLRLIAPRINDQKVL